jgi:hypothetical protein
MIEKLKLHRLRTEDDARRLITLMRDESIAPHLMLGSLSDDKILAAFADMRNIALLCEDSEKTLQGALFFHWQESGIYEAHTMARPLVRGRAYVEVVYEAIRTMFLMDTCMELWTRVPKGNKGALGLARILHGSERKMFSSQNSDYYQLHWDEWLWGRGKCSGEGLIAYGEWFHARLEQQFKEQGRTHTAHEDSADHNRMVGAACEMILNGLIEKGIILYNRWAKMAGYAQVSITITKPVLVINIGDALLQVDFAQREFLLLDSKPEDIFSSMPITQGGHELAV